MPDENQRANYSAQAVDHAAKLLRNGGASTLLLMTGSALTEHGLELAGRIAGKTGCKVMGQTYNPRMARGKGRFAIDRIPYVIEQALPILKDFRHIVLVEANDPVAFFAYPNKPSLLKPQGCEVHRMTTGAENSVAALEALAGALHAQAQPLEQHAGGVGLARARLAAEERVPREALPSPDDGIAALRGVIDPELGSDIEMMPTRWRRISELFARAIRRPRSLRISPTRRPCRPTRSTASS